MDSRAPVSHARDMNLARRLLALSVALSLVPCSGALAALPAKAKPRVVPARGHIGIGSAWGPVVVHPSHTGH